MRSIVFLDKPLWQQSAFHLLAGRKGVGKGTMLADLGARVTRGELGAKHNVVWIASEDSAAIDIKPRLLAAEGDPERVIVIKDWIQLPRDIDALSVTLAEVSDVGLVIIDPVGNHITGKNSNSDTDIRDAIAPLTTWRTSTRRCWPVFATSRRRNVKTGRSPRSSARARGRRCPASSSVSLAITRMLASRTFNAWPVTDCPRRHQAARSESRAYSSTGSRTR